MTVNQLRYSKEEFARRGDEIYESQVREQVEEGNYGKIVAINIETEAFEVAKDSLTASDELLARFPDAQIWNDHIVFYYQRLSQRVKWWAMPTLQKLQNLKVVSIEYGNC